MLYEVITALFAAASSDPQPEARKAAATQLANLHPDALPFAEELKGLFLRLTRDPFAGVRSTALNGLNNFRNPALIPEFRRMLDDSSSYAEASAMNGILTVDSVAGAAIVGQRLEKKSYSDVVQLAALDWVQKYRYTQFAGVIRRLAGPGHALPVRTKSFETLV